MAAQVLRNPCPGAAGIRAQVTPERVPKCARNTQSWGHPRPRFRRVMGPPGASDLKWSRFIPTDGAGRRREESMAFRELTMIDVKEVLRRWSAGQSDRRIGREAGADRKTVARYTVAATRLGLVRGGRGDRRGGSPGRAARSSASAVAPSDEWNEVAQHRERIERWLGGDGDTRPLRLSKVDTLLVRDHGMQASYDTLWRYAHQQLSWRDKPSTVRVDDPPPGQEAQVDFGKMGGCVDARRGTSHALGARRDAGVQPLPVRVADVPPDDRGRVRGTRPRWMFFGATIATLVPDNIKAIVRPDALNATLVPAFLDYVQARGLFVDPARVRRPRTSLASRIRSRTCARAGSTARHSPTSTTPGATRRPGAATSPERACTAPPGACRVRRSSRPRERRCGRTDGALRRAVWTRKPRSIPIITSRSCRRFTPCRCVPAQAVRVRADREA